MKRIEYRDQLTGVVRVAATNDEMEGLFVRGERDGAYRQTQGTGQRQYKGRKHFVAQLKRIGAVRHDESNIVAEYGWEPDPTRVIFRKDPDGDVYALMPDDIVDPIGHVSCYQHIGQHCAADYGHCIATSRPATPDEYADLKAELESIGYVVKPIKRNTGAR